MEENSYNFKNYILKDLYRYAGDTTCRSFFKHYFFSEGFRFTFWLRLCHFTRKNKILKVTVFPFCVLMYKHYRVKYGFDIPYSIEIGPGLLLFHLNGIIISAKSIGKNATISHCTTIGMKLKDGKPNFPIIGDNLYMAPGSKIVGGIKVGSNVSVATNAVLLNSVVDNCVVGGIPAKVIATNNSMDYIINPIE